MDNWFVKLLKIDPSDKKHILENPRFYIGILALVIGGFLIYIAQTL